MKITRRQLRSIITEVGAGEAIGRQFDNQMARYKQAWDTAGVPGVLGLYLSIGKIQLKEYLSFFSDSNRIEEFKKNIEEKGFSEAIGELSNQFDKAIDDKHPVQ